MGRLAMFLEGFEKGSKIRLLSKNGNVIFEGVKEDIPHRFEDRVNIILGSTKIGVNEVTIMINYDEEEDLDSI